MWLIIIIRRFKKFSIPLNKFPAGDLTADQAALVVELKDRFDLLETQLFTDQYLAANVIRFALLVDFQAGLVIDVHLPVDDLTAAFAFHVELIELARVGGWGGEDLLEEIHSLTPAWLLSSIA
jgi:hypothetical protein